MVNILSNHLMHVIQLPADIFDVKFGSDLKTAMTSQYIEHHWMFANQEG